MIDWNSRWYSDKQHFAELLLEDKKIRDFLKKKFGKKSGSPRCRSTGLRKR